MVGNVPGIYTRCRTKIRPWGFPGTFPIFLGSCRPDRVGKDVFSEKGAFPRIRGHLVRSDPPLGPFNFTKKDNDYFGLLSVM